MPKVKAIRFGYYNHKKRKEGETFIMKNVDADGFYIDENGKKKLSKDGKPIKCLWVTTDLRAQTVSEKDPDAIARAISGKFAGKKAEPEEEEELPEVQKAMESGKKK